MKRAFTNPLSPQEEHPHTELKHLQEIDDLITLINDGRWHAIEEILNKTQLAKPKTEEILHFLADYNFILLNDEHKKAKITLSLQKFLKGREAA